MEILAAIVTDVGRDTSQNHNTPFLQHTYSPPNVSKHAERWASGGSWLGNKATSWQKAAMLEANSSKRIYEGKRKKEGWKKFTLSFPFDVGVELKYANTLNQK